MVALLKKGLTDERKELVHERFLAMLPRIRRQALVAFRDRGRSAPGARGRSRSQCILRL